MPFGKVVKQSDAGGAPARGRSGSSTDSGLRAGPVAGDVEWNWPCCFTTFAQANSRNDNEEFIQVAVMQPDPNGSSLFSSARCLGTCEISVSHLADYCGDFEKASTVSYSRWGCHSLTHPSTHANNPGCTVHNDTYSPARPSHRLTFPTPTRSGKATGLRLTVNARSCDARTMYG